jgi:hypothetical protein
VGSEGVDLASLLVGLDDGAFVRTQVLERIPFILNDAKAQTSWRTRIASAVGLPASALHIVGSAATGYCLRHEEPGREFRSVAVHGAAASDIDIAVVDEQLFGDCWSTLVLHDHDRLLGRTPSKRSQIRENVYWGYVNQWVLPRGTAPVRRISAIKAECSRQPSTRGYRASVRIYRREDDMRMYLVNSIRKLRHALGL